MNINDIDSTVDSFNRDGFVEISGIVAPEQLDFYYTKALENFDEVISLIKQKERRFEIGNN